MIFFIYPTSFSYVTEPNLKRGSPVKSMWPEKYLYNIYINTVLL